MYLDLSVLVFPVNVPGPVSGVTVCVILDSEVVSNECETDVSRVLVFLLLGYVYILLDVFIDLG